MMDENKEKAENILWQVPGIQYRDVRYSIQEEQNTAANRSRSLAHGKRS